MKTFGLAPFAVIVLWLGLSSVWMANTGSPRVAEAATTSNPDTTPQPITAAVPSGPVMIDLSWKTPSGPVMTDLLAAPDKGSITAAPAAVAPDSGAETLVRLQALETRLTVALEGLEQRGGDGSRALAAAQAPSFLAQLATVGRSAPIIGFLVMLMLVLAVAAKGQPFMGSNAARRLTTTLRRLTAIEQDAVGQAQTLNASLDPGSNRKRGIYGQAVTHIQANGLPLQAGAFDENQVRAAAGLTLALGAVAFAYAYLGKAYLPIQAVTTLFFVEFLIRVTMGITRSPLGSVAGWMTRRNTPHWVSAKPKRFAWSLGLAMSLAMMIITNSGIRGPLPLTICLICLTLMWLEAVLGLCLGCEIHRYLVRQGWMQPDKDFEICTNGACTAQPQFER